MPVVLESNDPTAFIEEEDIAKRFNADLIAEALKEEDNPTKQKLTLSIWDYGGQEVFYALHHIFLSEFGVYCVVFDMSLLVGSSATQATREKCIQRVQFWLRSICMHAKSAPVFLVGTRKDAIHTQYDHKVINSLLEQRVKVATNAQIIPNCTEGSNDFEGLWFFPVDNSLGVRDPIIQTLREKILDSVKEKEYVKMPVSMNWTRVLDLLLKQREITPYLTLTRVAEIAQSIEVTTKIHDMLHFFHELGVLCYFDSSVELRQLVILEPQWLVDALTHVIRDFRFHPLNLMGDTKLRLNFSFDVNELQTRGIISKRLLFHFWKDESEATREFLIELMKNMSLLCDWTAPGEDISEIRFLVPSLFDLDQNLSTLPRNKRKIKSELFFEFNFQRFFLPHGLFPRLVAMVVNQGSAVFEDSAVPWVTKTKAVVSFGEADFQMEHLVERDIIRVGVADPAYFMRVHSNLVSMLRTVSNQTMRKALKIDVHLLLEVRKKLIPCLFDKVIEARENKKPTVRAVDGTLFGVSQFDAFFNQETAQESGVSAPILPRGFENHFFVSYYQETGRYLTGELVPSLQLKKFTVWYDKLYKGNLNEQAMLKGVESSCCLLLILTKGV